MGVRRGLNFPIYYLCLGPTFHLPPNLRVHLPSLINITSHLFIGPTSNLPPSTSHLPSPTSDLPPSTFHLPLPLPLPATHTSILQI